MIPLADRMNDIAPSATMAIAQKTRELTASGADVIGLGLGEPDFPTPDHVKKAACEAIAAGKTKYTPVDGTPELKAAIIAKFKIDNGLDFAPSQITVGNGAKQVIFNAMATTLNEGDEVIIPSPYWVSYPDMVRINGGVLVMPACTVEDGFKLQADALEAAITKKTKWLILNSPTNPTGATYSKAELLDLADVLKGHPQVTILSDDLYEHMIYDGVTFCTMAQIAPELRERTLTVNGVSKAWAMTGWRIGFAGGPEALIRAMTKYQGQSTSNPCSISQAATVAALTGSYDFMEDRLAIYKERRDLAVSLLNEAPGITCALPEGAFYAFPSIKGMIGAHTPDGQTITGSADFVRYLLETHGVAALPGEAFGDSSCFRISTATATDLLEKACQRIIRAAAALDVKDQLAYKQRVQC
ncbi:MAG: pyridoxal phosphate-dependent aminotransferase [Pseudomonadota bacterium]|nr:pyridoxal phosphate-dependent aminotransferase [Pseudomonadota bacterium]